MANELNLSTATTGQTITANIYLGGAVVGSPISCPEVVGAGGYYSGNMPVVGFGHYIVNFYASSVLVGQGDIVWSGTQEMNAGNIADDVWLTVLDGQTAENLIKLMSAVLLGKVSGAGTGTETFKSVNGINDRVVSVNDAAGNRTAVTLTP